MRLTIQDVAREAGVSVSTVDRVLNKRSGVRHQTVERVQGVVDRLNYQPDRLAARLARAREYRIVFVVPKGFTAFLDELNRHLLAAAERGIAERVILHIEPTDVFDGAELAHTLNGLDEAFDGVAVVALDHPLVREAIDGLRASGRQVVTLVSDLPSSRRQRFVGIDNAAAGRTAANILGRFAGPRKGVVGLIVGSLSLRDHVERRFGFEQVLTAEYPNLTILPIAESRDNHKRIRSATAQWLAQKPRLLGLYNTGAGNRGAIEALEKAGRAREVVFIAHELTPFSRRALATGTIDAVINQNVGHEVRSAVRVLLALIDDTEVLDDQERIRIDIFLRDNLP